MAAGSWLWVLRGRGMRHTKNTKGRSEGDDDDVQLDWSKDCAENVREILSNICKKHGISEGRKLGYLNAFVKLLMKYENDFSPLGFTSEEILYCLRPALVHETTQVRAGCLRALRYFLRRKQEAAFCIKLQYPFLIARSLDLVVGNDTERVQALRVIRRLLCINASDFPVSLVRAVVSVPASYGEDRLLNACLAVLTEICILNPDLFIACGGVTVILRNLTAVKSARMAEALIGALLYLLNKPDTRLKARMNLDCLAAPFTDLHSVDKARDTGQTNESRLKWPHVTLLSMLRSWPGVLHFCHPEREGLRSIVATLYLNQLDVRKAVLDLLYELLCLAQPEWSDEMSVALEAVDPSRSQEAFRLSEGFVAAEGKAVLSHLSKCRVNLSEVHLSLLLYSFLEAGLLDAIVEVIVSEDTFLSVRATILLGELLHLIHLLLPPECCHLTPALPNLLSYAVRGRPTTCRKPLLMSKNKNAEELLTKVTFPIRNNIKQSPYIQDERKKKNSIQHQRLSVRSGHSSVRTVSESSTDKVIKLDKPENGKLVDNGLNPLENKMMDEAHDTSVQQQELVSEPTTHLLQDVREVLSDLTYTSNVKSPNLGAKFIQSKPKSVYSTVDRTCTGAGAEYIPHSHYNNITLNVDPPYCSRSQQRALASVSALSKLHRLLRKRPAPASIFLDHVLTSVDHKESLEGMDLARVKGKTLSKNKLAQALTKECEDAIKESGVLSVKDCFAWNWDVIRAILKSRPDCFKKAEDHNQKQFLRRLVQFITPTARQLSRVELGTDRRTANTFTLAACELIDCLLLGLEESECEKLLSEFLFVLKSEFSSISTAKSAHDCLLSPQNVTNSLCQDYFLLVGHLTRTEAGQVALDKSGILSVLLELAAATNHDCYVKLIISSLDYSRDSMTRMIMTRVLSCKQVSSRLYATKFLHVLLRTPLRKHRDYVSWVIELLVNQLYDENKAISLAAINALDEACDCKEYLEAMINLRPSLLHLGDRGLLLLVRFLSLPQGFSYLCEANFVSNQLQKWATHYNYRYVCIVEGVLSDALTLVEKNEDGRYSSRLSNIKHAPGDVYVPPHLYGQLCQLEVGFNTLVADENISRLCQIIFLGLHNTDNEILELKAALWAIGHMTSSVYGAQWARQQGITKAILQLAQRCPVYSIRAAAFYSISLSATNSEGADTLRAAGWHTVRHNRHERWPVVESLSFLEEAFFQAEEERSVNRDSIGSSEINIEQLTKGGLFFLPEDSTVESDDYFTGFTAREKAFRERKSATLPPTGVQPTYHHNRSYSESKADSDWPNTTSPAQSNSGIDIHDFSDRVVQTLSPIPSSGSLSMVKPQRKTSVSSNYSGQANVRTNSRLSPQDALGYAKLRSLNRSRRPLLSPTPSLSLSFSPSTQVNLSPLSPIELLAFQDWKQMSPLVRPKHCDNQPLSSEFEARGIRWPLLSDAAAARTLHYESSRSCITDSPDNVTEDMTSYGPCYLGICLPQRLIDLFPDLEPENKFEFIPIDNNQDLTVGDVSSGDSETDTAPESKEIGEGDKPVIKSTRGFMKRRHDRNNCLLCSMSRHGNNKQTRWRKISASSVHRIRTETESSYGGVGNDGESPVMLPWQVRGGLEGVNSVDSSSTDMTSLVQRSLGDTFKSRSVVRKEMLRLAEQLSNPVLYKTCKQALLQLKQVYSDVFNDICVYSDISIVMASAPLRVQSRRFLQELFLDSPFSELYDEPAFILNLPEGEDQSSTEKTNANQSMDSIPFEEQSTQDSVPCRKCGTKMNGFDTEQRNNQSYELEVIMETDARSECSDICKVENNEDKTRLQAAVQSYQDSEDFPESALDLPVHIECLPVLIKVETLAKDKSVTVQPPDIPEALFQMKTTKSKQQLREEFFAPSVSSKANDTFTKKSPGKSKIVNEKPDLKTNSASKIKSQVEAKLNTTSNSNDQSSIKSSSASSSKRDSSSEEKLPVLKNEIPRNSFKNGKSVENSKENLQSSSSKGAKPRSSDSFTTNKNNSTSIGRQRKRATTKTPNRESLETTPRVRRDSDKEDIRRKK